MTSFYRLFSLTVVAVLTACGSNQGSTNAASVSQHNADSDSFTTFYQAFDADSAYAFVGRQVAFGPRVPNTDAHRSCGNWLSGKLREYGADVTEQNVVLKAYDGTQLNARNIIASVNPEATKRILLLSHWDSRPWADQDPDQSRRDLPIDGANDGASGVGVILEVVRCLSQNTPRIGVDIMFVDAEDYGTRADLSDDGDSESSWCLGSTYWANTPTLDLSTIRYAVLLDMVGGKDAVFPKEYFSQYACPDIVDKVWKAAKDAGHGARFTKATGMPVIDDHLPLIRAGVPSIDIIETDHPKTKSFNPTWHTHADNMDNIDKQTLQAVGQTLLNLIYTE